MVSMAGLNMNSWIRSALAGAGVLALLGVAAHFAAAPLSAQSSSAREPDDYRYRLAKVDEMVPRRAGDEVEEVIPLGADNVFLLAVKDEIVVFRIENENGSARNRRIGTIPLLRNGWRDVDEVIVLDDKRSFLIRTDIGVAAYAVTKQGVFEE
jgi:hypothetical protein